MSSNNFRSVYFNMLYRIVKSERWGQPTGATRFSGHTKLQQKIFLPCNFRIIETLFLPF